MKILYCITSSSWGGAQLHVLELCQDQVNRGNEVVFVVGNEGPLLDKVRRIPQVKTIVLKTLHREISPLNDIKAIFELRNIIKKEKPDIVHLHSSKAGTIGRLANIGLKSKAVFTVHGWAFTDGISSKRKKGIFRLIEKLVAPFSDLIICVSEYDYKIGMRDRVINHRNAVVIHNGVPSPQNFNVFERIVHNPVKLVMTARFSPQKDQETLINAVSKLNKDDYKLIFVGDGETLDANKALVKELQLQDNIDFVGFKKDVTPYLKNSDIYILSTKYEGLPISIIEAMSYGLPIIATNVGGNSELVINNGYLVNNEDELINALDTLISNRKQIKLFGEESYRMFKDEYLLQRCMDKTNAQYNKLLNA